MKTMKTLKSSVVLFVVVIVGILMCSCRFDQSWTQTSEGVFESNVEHKQIRHNGTFWVFFTSKIHQLILIFFIISNRYYAQITFNINICLIFKNYDLL